MRIISFDCGNTHTGIVIIDVTRDSFNICHMHCHEDNSNHMASSLIDYVTEHIYPKIDGYKKKDILMIYERLIYPNWTLQNIQRNLVLHFKNTLKIKTRSLYPSQKPKGCTCAINRKKQCVETIKKQLSSHWLTIFDSYERNHDIADAIMMAKYTQF